MLRNISLPRGGVLLMALFLVFGLDQPEARSEPDLPLQLAISTDRPIYTPGQTVRFTLLLTNRGETDITLSFRSSQQADFVVRREDKEIWRWSNGRMFAQALTKIKLEPGGQREILATWDQNDGKGNTAPAGSYDAVGLILAEDRRDRVRTSFKMLAPPISDPVR